MKPLPTNPTFEEVLEIGRESLAATRVGIDSTETEVEVDASGKAYLLRVIDVLEDLFDPGPIDDDETRILARALTVFLPVLDLDWLPASVDEMPELSDDDLMLLGLLRKERRMQAAKRAGRSKAGRWDGLIDVISESIEVFVLYGYQEGVSRVNKLLDATEANLTSQRKAPVN